MDEGYRSLVSGASWQPYENGKTLSTHGSEDGIIIADEDLLGLARITLEKGARRIPFAITFGVRGLFVHTTYLGSDEYLPATLRRLEYALRIVVEKNLSSSTEQDVQRLVVELISEFS